MNIRLLLNPPEATQSRATDLPNTAGAAASNDAPAQEPRQNAGLGALERLPDELLRDFVLPELLRGNHLPRFAAVSRGARQLSLEVAESVSSRFARARVAAARNATGLTGGSGRLVPPPFSPEQSSRAEAFIELLARHSNPLGRATEALSNGQGRAALVALQEATARWPEEPAAHLDMAQLLLRMDELSGAKESFLRAQRCGCDWATAERGLGEIARQRGEQRIAEAHLQRALDVRPNYPEAQMSMGLLLWEQSRQITDRTVSAQQQARLLQARAVALCGQAFALDTNLLAAGVLVAEHALHCENYAEAQETYRRLLLALHAAKVSDLFSAAQQTAAERGARLGLAKALLGCAQGEEASRHLQRLIVCSPRTQDDVRREALVLLAQLRREQRQLGEAEQLVSEGIRLHGRDACPAVRALRGEILLEQGRAREAVQSFRRALAQQPGFVPACLGLARALLADGQPQNARDALESLRGHASLCLAEANESLLTLAESYLVAPQPNAAGAERHYRLLLQRAPGHPEALAGLLLAQQAQGHWRGSAATRHDIDVMGATHPMRLLQVGRMLGRLGDAGAASWCFRLALIHLPQCAEAHLLLAKALVSRPNLHMECKEELMHEAAAWHVRRALLLNDRLAEAWLMQAQLAMATTLKMFPAAEFTLPVSAATVEALEAHEKWILTCLRRARTCRRDFPEAWLAEGHFWRNSQLLVFTTRDGRPDSNQCFASAVALRPNDAALHEQFLQHVDYEQDDFDWDTLVTQSYEALVRLAPPETVGYMRGRLERWLAEKDLS